MGKHFSSTINFNSNSKINVSLQIIIRNHIIHMNYKNMIESYIVDMELYSIAFCCKMNVKLISIKWISDINN